MELAQSLASEEWPAFIVQPRELAATLYDRLAQIAAKANFHPLIRQHAQQGLHAARVPDLAQRGILPHLSQADVQDRVRLVAVCDPAEGRADALSLADGRKPSLADEINALAGQDKVEDYLEKLRGMTPFDLDTAQRYLLLANEVPGVRVSAALIECATQTTPYCRAEDTLLAKSLLPPASAVYTSDDAGAKRPDRADRRQWPFVGRVGDLAPHGPPPSSSDYPCGRHPQSDDGRNTFGQRLVVRLVGNIVGHVMGDCNGNGPQEQQWRQHPVQNLAE